jgi:hypothetical protein
MPGPVRTLSHLAFWLAAALGAVLFGVLVLTFAGVVPVDSPERPAAAEERAVLAAARPAAQPEVESPPPTTVQKPPAPERVTVVVTASRGDSWIAARIGSESGRVLQERLLAQGETARVTAARIWLLVGASANVDVLVDGKRRLLAAGTVETTFAPPVR